MYQQVCTIEPSFFKTMSEMHRRPFEGWHLVGIGMHLTPCGTEVCFLSS